MPNDAKSGPAPQTEGVWTVTGGGSATAEPPHDPYRPDGTENLTYNNPYGLQLERVWFDGKLVYAISGDEVDVDLTTTKVAQEYQIVHYIELDAAGKLVDDDAIEMVEGQYNIYDSVPGMAQYSPLWQFNFVLVGFDYIPNALRSEADCLTSGYPIKQSTIVEN